MVLRKKKVYFLVTKAVIFGCIINPVKPDISNNSQKKTTIFSENKQSIEHSGNIQKRRKKVCMCFLLNIIFDTSGFYDYYNIVRIWRSQ